MRIDHEKIVHFCAHFGMSFFLCASLHLVMHWWSALAALAIGGAYKLWSPHGAEVSMTENALGVVAAIGFLWIQGVRL